MSEIDNLKDISSNLEELMSIMVIEREEFFQTTKLIKDVLDMAGEILSYEIDGIDNDKIRHLHKIALKAGTHILTSELELVKAEFELSLFKTSVNSISPK